MKHADIIYLPLMVREILLAHSDAEHMVEMREIRQYLSEMGYEADRRSIYKAINALNEYGDEIVYEAKNGKQGYRIRHPFTLAESFFLIDAVNVSNALSADTSMDFSGKIRSMLSEHERKSLPENMLSAAKTENDQILKTIGILLKAIPQRNPVEFRYYDLSVTRKKQYRKANKKYHLIPYALLSDSGRYYCVFYSPVHQSFANYRIDKMDMIHVIEEEQADPVYFSLKDHIRSSFNMYHGEAETITVRFDLSLANIVFDEFGKDIIISAVDEKHFIASIRSAITPTLISWLLQFYDRMEVMRPESLRQRMNDIGESLIRTYQIQEDH